MLILIDSNAMGHAHHNSTKLTTPSGMEVQAIYGFVRMLRALKETYQNNRIMMLWDGQAKFRKEILPEYKANRAIDEADPEQVQRRDAYRNQVVAIKYAAKLMGVTQVVCNELEADDLAGMFVGKRKEPVTLMTGDSDWLQLVSDDVSWHDPRKGGKRVNMENFHLSTGYATPGEYIEGKALIGDSTDNIPGVGGIGGKGACELLAEHRSVAAFFEKVDGGWKPKAKKFRDFAADGRDAFERNMKLMNLRYTGVVPFDYKMHVTPGELDAEKLLEFFSKLGFISITRQWNQWVMPLTPSVKQSQ